MGSHKGVPPPPDPGPGKGLMQKPEEGLRSPSNYRLMVSGMSCMEVRAAQRLLS